MEEHKMENKMEDQRPFEQKTHKKSFKYVNLNNVQDIINLLEKNSFYQKLTKLVKITLLLNRNFFIVSNK